MEFLTLSKESQHKKNVVDRSYFPVSKLKRGENKYSIVDRETNQILSGSIETLCLSKECGYFRAIY